MNTQRKLRTVSAILIACQAFDTARLAWDSLSQHLVWNIFVIICMFAIILCAINLARGVEWTRQALIKIILIYMAAKALFLVYFLVHFPDSLITAFFPWILMLGLLRESRSPEYAENETPKRPAIAIAIWLFYAILAVVLIYGSTHSEFLKTNKSVIPLGINSVQYNSAVH